MRRKDLVTVVALLLAGSASAMAQASGPARPDLARAISAARLRLPATTITPQDANHDWSNLQRLTQKEIVLVAQGQPGRTCRLVSVDDAAITVALEQRGHPTLRIPRSDVSEIQQRTGRRGSVAGAAVGAAGGFGLGLVLATKLVYKQCGGSCADEKFLIGVSLVGIPIAGGLLGYRVGGDHRTLTTVYVKP